MISMQVEALTLSHANGSFEIACNLLNVTDGISIQRVLKHCTELIDNSNQENRDDMVELRIASTYTTSPSMESLVLLTKQLLINN